MLPQLSRKSIYIIVAALVVIVAILAIAVSLNSSNQEQTDQAVVPFKINGLDNPKYLFSTDTQEGIKSGIEGYLTADNIKTNGVTGIIRKDSYAVEETPDATMTTLLIDIPAIKRTYKVSSAGSGDPDGDNSLYILCPSSEELIYGKFDCKDDIGE